jgi:Protein of unknown function (DUF3300)
MMTSFRVLRKGRGPIRGVAAALSVLLVAPVNTLAVMAQTPTPTPTSTQAQAATKTEKDEPKLTADQLDALVAPIALYSDPLLSQSLVASTYPLELVQAQQWLEKNKNLKGDELTKAVEKQKWDPSVQATAVVPDLLKRLTEDITWTHNLGNAFLEQQSDAMDAVQRLRKKAKDAGKLDSSEQQKVETKVVETKTIIEIQPTSTTVVYVPAYSPTVIWGPMYYPYPPIYYPPYYGGAWLGFGVGIAVGIGISGGYGWGCGWGGGGNIYINNNNNFNRVNHNNINTGNINTGNINRGNSSWQHNPSHRGNAPYSSANTANKFGGSTRDQMASRSGTAASNLGANRTGTSAASAGANRAGAGATASSRSTGGDKVGSRNIPQSSSRTSGLGGASSGSTGASRAGAASARGGSSMGSRGGGGRRR